MLKRLCLTILVLSLAVMGPGVAQAGNGEGSSGTSSAGITEMTSKSGGGESGQNQESGNTSESQQTAVQNQNQENSGAADTTTTELRLMEETRVRLQTMLQDQDMNQAEWSEVKENLKQLKLQYHSRTEAREEIRNTFKYALQNAKQMKDVQETEDLLRDIISMEPMNPDEYKELGYLFRNRGENSCHIWCNGNELVTDVSPVIKQGRTLIPVRAITEALGAKVQWNQAEQTVLISKDETNICLQLRNQVALVNGQQVRLDVPPEINNSRVFVPVRFCAELMNSEVNYYPEGKIIAINQE